MADNVSLQTVSLATPPDGTQIATDNIGGINFQRIKVTWGADGTANDASAASPFPIDGSGVTQPVSYATTGSGTVTGALRVEIANNGAGQIATVSTVSAVTAITNALPAGTNTIGKTFIAPQTSKALTNASVSISSSGDNTIVAGTAAQTVRVFKLVLVAASAVSVTLKDGAGSSLTGAIPLVANGAMTIESSDGEPEFITSSGNGFIVNLSGAVTVTGWVQFTKS